MDVKKAFGKNLAKVRKLNGVSQEKLALESGLARSYISGVERGQRNISLVNICLLADTLEVSALELMNFGKEDCQLN